MTCAELSRKVVLLRKGQIAPCRNHLVCRNDYRAVMQSRLGKENRFQQVGGNLRVQPYSAVQNGPRDIVAQHDKRAGVCFTEALASLDNLVYRIVEVVNADVGKAAFSIMLLPTEVEHIVAQVMSEKQQTCHHAH